MITTDENGNVIDRTVDGFHARVVQHECDHLNGILYPMRIKDFKKFGFTEVLFPGPDATNNDDDWIYTGYMILIWFDSTICCAKFKRSCFKADTTCMLYFVVIFYILSSRR